MTIGEGVPVPGTIFYAKTRGVMPLLNRVANRNLITVQELLFSSNRSAQVTAARRESIKLLRERGMVDAEIARVLGVHQSTVLYHGRKERERNGG